MFRSRDYSWSDLVLLIGTTPITGLRGIEYEEGQELEYLRGAGNEPLDIMAGNKEYPGTLSLLESAITALEQASPTKSILGQPYTISVSYLKMGMIHTDIIGPLMFSKVPKGMKQGDKFAQHDLPFLSLGVKKGA